MSTKLELSLLALSAKDDLESLDQAVNQALFVNPPPTEAEKDLIDKTKKMLRDHYQTFSGCVEQIFGQDNDMTLQMTIDKIVSDARTALKLMKGIIEKRECQ